jgi:rhodanese-related sulfurtransferase
MSKLNPEKSILIYSRGEFENLPEDQLKNKAIIRIHNYNDKDWYNSNYPYGIELFFDDMKCVNLSWWDKLQGKYYNKDNNKKFFTAYQAKLLISFIEKNKNKDFIIHCEYGHSRSVAIGIFIKEQYKPSLINRTPKELLKANDWVLKLLVESFKK